MQLEPLIFGSYMDWAAENTNMRGDMRLLFY